MILEVKDNTVTITCGKCKKQVAILPEQMVVALLLRDLALLVNDPAINLPEPVYQCKEC